MVRGFTRKWIYFTSLEFQQDLGLKCSAWKVFGSKDFGLVGLYQKTRPDLFWSKKIFGQKKFCSEKMFVQMKILGIKIIFGSKKVWVQKSFWAKKVFGFKKDFGSKKILGQNNFWSKKIYVYKIWVHKFLGPKNIWKSFGSKKIWVRKNFGSEKILVQKKFGFQNIV